MAHLPTRLGKLSFALVFSRLRVLVVNRSVCVSRAVHVILRDLDAAGSCAGSVGDIVASEPVIGAALLRVVNSAALGVRRRILTVSQAVAYLGFASVRAVVMRLKLAQLMPGPARG